jgi:hypothetical protein
MNQLEFIVSLSRTLAWPAIVLVCVLLFRKPLSEAIPLLRKLKAGGYEAEFATEVDKNQEIISDIPHINTYIPHNNTFRKETEMLLPLEIIVVAWSDLRRTVLEAAEALGVAIVEDDTSATLKSLMKIEKIDRRTIQVIKNLEELKNKAIKAQDVEFPEEEAKNYAAQTQIIIMYLQGLTKPQ